MFFTNSAIIDSLIHLKSVHPFFGITYLTCKYYELSIEEAVDFPINYYETKILEQFYKPIPNTEKFYRVFRTSEQSKYWLNADYASSGSQATRTQSFGDAFVHPKGSNQWGWVNNYIQILKEHLRNKKIPLWHLAIWIYKDFNWDISKKEDIRDKFINDFHINKEELELLFDSRFPASINTKYLFSKTKFDWQEISVTLKIPAPPDLPVEKGGSLVNLKVSNVGDISFDINLSNRLNIITGDNGLGKSFILECAWWALTGSWTGLPFYPDSNSKNNPLISYKISNKQSRINTFIAEYNWRIQKWELLKNDQNTIPGLIIYARVDGAFAIWDPARVSIDNSIETIPSTLVFTREDIWNGVRRGEGQKSRSIFNGLITDWVHWQTSNNEIFTTLKKVLKRLSPPGLKHGDLGILEPGNITRLPGESRPIPTIRHPYGEVPIIFASAAVKRIIALAYLIVWTWEEHKISSMLIREEPETKMVVIADEIESHLHPQWQRVILPALLSISDDLSKNLNVQYIITTHSPLVMASVEPLYNEETDRIFHLNLRQNKKGSEVILENPEFQKRGSADSWLVSEIFELKQPRSIEAENTIEKAKSILKEQYPNPSEISKITEKLLEVLPPHDTFWIRWNYFAEQNGITEEEHK